VTNVVSSKDIRNAPKLTDAFTMPVVAWPTILIYFVSFAGFGLSSYAFLTGLLSAFLTVPISAFFIFWSFTPLHEAVHRNLSSIDWLNDSVGTLSAQLLLPGFTSSLYRYLHMTHHTRTGQNDDPDLKFTESNLLICWFNSAFLDVLWTRFYFSVWRERPMLERTQFTLGLILYITMFVVAFSSPYLVEFTVTFLLPMFLGRITTVHLLATIQHRKGHEQRVDPLGATSVQDVHSNWWRHLFMLGQSQHLIHHLFPGVPWYKYDGIWQVAKSKVPADVLRPSNYISRNHKR
jgi:vanillate O-demethylase ferredoxin subunit